MARERKSLVLLLDKGLSGLGRTSGPLAGLAAPYAWTIPVVAVTGLAASALEGVGISLLVPLLANLSVAPIAGSGFLGALYGLPGLFPPEWRLVGLSGVILGCIILKGLISGGLDILVNWTEGSIARDIRGRLAERLLNVGYPFFLTTRQSRLLDIIATQSWNAADTIHAGFDVIRMAATILVFGALLLLTDWRIFLVTAAGALLIRLLQNRINRLAAVIGERMRRINLELAHRMIMATFDMVKLVRLFSQEKAEYRRFGAASEGVRRETMRLAMLGAWAGPISEMLYGLLFLGVLVGAHAEGVPLPVLIAFLLLVYRMQPHISGLAAAGMAIASTAAAVRDVEWLLEERDKPVPPTGGRPFAGLTDAIRFEEVTFSYEARGPARALDSVSFEISAGRWTGLVGPSGAGKSTTVNLLGRLLEPTSGRILVDGVDLKEIDPLTWRARLGFAGQDLDLFEASVAENIGFGAPEAGRDAIEEAARLADVHDLVMAMPQGYDTTLGERGLALSAGQRQRIGLARALVRRPSVLILDEATNALDADSEARLLGRLKAQPGLTVVVVSHRPSTLAFCDRLVMLETQFDDMADGTPAGATGGGPEREYHEPARRDVLAAGNTGFAE